MNKLFLTLGLAFLSMGVSAQEPRWTVSILPGYQFNTQSYQEDKCWYKMEFQIKTNLMGSVDVGLGLTEHYGLHFAYLVNDGKYSARDVGSYWTNPWSQYNAPIAIWEVGPEWKFRLSQKAHFYLQVNAGRTVSSGQRSYTSDCGYYSERAIRDNEWVYGAAAGFRFFFLENAGIAGQVAYHRINGWPNSQMWDLRLGATFRF